MKKILLFAVALALPLLFSCKKDNKDAGSAGIPTGVSYNSACSFVGDGMWATFNGDKTYVAGKIPAKDVSPYEVIWGTYTYANNVYTMFGEDTEVVWGKLEVLSDSKVKVTIGKNEPVEVSVVTTRPVAGNDGQRAASHTWKPVSATLIYKGLTYNSANGINLNDFEEWALKYDLIKESIFNKGMVVEQVIVSDACVAVVFENGQVFVGHIPENADLAGFTMQQVSIKGTDTLPVFQGQTSISFSNGKCLVGIMGSYQSESASVVLTFAL